MYSKNQLIINIRYTLIQYYIYITYVLKFVGINC
jgi:hypothetical protein